MERERREAALRRAAAATPPPPALVYIYFACEANRIAGKQEKEVYVGVVA